MKAAIEIAVGRRTNDASLNAKYRPPKLTPKSSFLLAFYGDDFTGSTDAMDVLCQAGVATVLFLKPPKPEELERYKGIRAFGIAGGSRAMTPAQMRRELPAAFDALKRSGAPLVHYKVCSTFDSAPHIGSIGTAIEIGRKVFGSDLTPVVSGTPRLGRYVVFSNLFARAGSDVDPARIDRHPTMRKHPVTPMLESDLARHLSAQTALPIGAITLLGLRGAGQAQDATLEALLPEPARKRAPIAVIDSLDEADLATIGRLLCRGATSDRPLFCVGSSGIEVALTLEWQRRADIDQMSRRAAAGTVPSHTGTPQTIVISGSCSPVTHRQIACAMANGFVGIRCNARRLSEPKQQARAVGAIIAEATPALRAGRSVIFHTAAGRSGFVAAIAATPARNGTTGKRITASERLSRALAMLLEAALRVARSRLAVVCGGDTSTHVARALGIQALEFSRPAAAGAPLCRVRAPGRVVDGCEFVFKGGQMGGERFLLDL